MVPAWVCMLLLQALTPAVSAEDGNVNGVALDVKPEELNVTLESLGNGRHEGATENIPDVPVSAAALMNSSVEILDLNGIVESNSTALEENTELIPEKVIRKRSKTRLVRKKRTFSKHKCIMCGVLSHIMKKHKMYMPQPQPQPCHTCAPPPPPQPCHTCGPPQQPMYHPPPQPMYHPPPQPVYHPPPQPVYHPPPQPVYHPPPQPVYHPPPQPMYHPPPQPTCDPCSRPQPQPCGGPNCGGSGGGWSWSKSSSSASSQSMAYHGKKK